MMKTRLGRLILNALPVLVMIGLIPFVSNDYILAAIYLVLAGMMFRFTREHGDGAAYVFGFVALTISESFFVGTGVEHFSRTSLFGIMPVWLPLLWAYAFVAIKRSLKILGL